MPVFAWSYGAVAAGLLVSAFQLPQPLLASAVTSAVVVGIAVVYESARLNPAARWSFPVLGALLVVAALLLEGLSRAARLADVFGAAALVVLAFVGPRVPDPTMPRPMQLARGTPRPGGRSG